MHVGERIPVHWVKRYPIFISFGLSLLLVVLGVRNFVGTYPMDAAQAPVFITAGLGSYGRAAFFSTFFFFSAILTAMLILAHLIKDEVWIGVFLVIATTCMIVATYSLHDYLEIKLPLAVALLITSGLRMQFPLNLILSSLSAAAVILFQYCRTLFGESIIALELRMGQPKALAVFSLVTVTVGVLAILLRQASDALSYERAMLNHQQNVMTQLSVFNQRLQEHAKEIGEEAAQQERNRISREMHDSSGYVFTNIMALVDAAISGGGRDWSKLEDLLQTASSQARDGLQETRRTLRALRKIEPSLFSSIDSIYQIARIFGETTHIEVQVEIGNMERDYGQYINRTLCRIVQEALTNAIRHGRASKVMIQFWVSHGSLCMIVSDNGVGSKQVVKGIGLAGMEERLAPLGGSIQTSTPEEGGFRLTINIPLRRIPDPDDINTLLANPQPEVVHV